MNKTFGAIGVNLYSSGWPVIPLKRASKIPTFKNWVNGISKGQDLSSYIDGNIGLLAEMFPGVDIDVRDEVCAQAIEVALQIELGIAPIRVGSWPKRLLMYRTERPFKKIKVFLTGPNGNKDTTGKDFAIEFLGDGQQYVIYGEHPDGHEYTWTSPEEPLTTTCASLELINQEDVVKFIASLPVYLPPGWSILNLPRPVPMDLDALAFYKPQLTDWNLDRVDTELLSQLDPNCDHDEWLRIGLALHHQGKGDTAWLTLWDDWSKPGNTYSPGLCANKWQTFEHQKVGSNITTLASLIYQVNEIDKKEQTRVFDKNKELINNCITVDELRSVADKIKVESGLDHMSRGVLAQTLKDKFKSLKFPISIADAKELIKPKGRDGVPEWLTDWVYVTHEDKFFNSITKRKVTAVGFAAMFNRLTFDDSAVLSALSIYRIPTPDKIIYLPRADDLFELNGIPCVNEYNKDSPPDIPVEFSLGDLDAIEAVKAHLSMILTEPGSVDIMISWMAFNVQNPGVKIRWAPLIKGIEGDGKSVLGNLMMGVMGMANVGIVSPSVLATGFTSWAAGRCVNVLEEIRMVGHNRHDVLNTIKPYITNDQITVHPKGVNEYVAPNTVNYIAFTNHADALPLEDTDRRWWVQFTPFTDQEELQLAAGYLYFNRLFDLIKHHPAGLRKWLLEYQVIPSFTANGQAPASSAKNQMVGLNTSNELEAIKTLLQTGGHGFNATMFSSRHLTMALSFLDDIEVPRGQGINKIFMKLGYLKIEKPVKWDGKACTIWLKNRDLDLFSKMDVEKINKQVRLQLDVTYGKDLLE